MGEDAEVGATDSIKQIIDVNEETDQTLSEKLTETGKKHDAILMACIAPYVGLKVSPTKTINAQMGLSEEFAVETAINCCPEKKKLRIGDKNFPFLT